MLYQCPYCNKVSDVSIDASYQCPHCKEIVELYDLNDFMITNNTLKRYKGTRKEVIVPQTVHIIDDFAFSLSRFIEKVYLSDNVYRIGSEAFSKALNFKIIYIPKTVEMINQYAFSGCDKLTIITDYVSKPKSWSSLWNSTKIPVLWGLSQYKIDNLFNYIVNNNKEIFLLECVDKNIDTINLKDLYQYPIKGICRSCFEGCSKLKSIVISDKVEFIGKYAFKDCVLLQNIKLPKSLKTLGKYAFDNCDSLDEIIIPNNLRRLEMDSFSNGNLKRLVVSSSKTLILRGTQWNRRSLESLILPEDMNEINELIFKGCTSLSYMKISKVIRGKFTIPTKCIVETYDVEINRNSKLTKMIRILERIDQGISVKATFLDRRAYRYNCYYKAEVGDIVYAVYKGQKIKGVVVDYLDQISTLPNVNTITEVYRMVSEDYDFNLLDARFYNNTKTIDKVLFALDRLKEGNVSKVYFDLYLKYLKDVLFINGNGLLKYLFNNYEYDYINILCDYKLITHNIEEIVEYCAVNNHIMMMPVLLQYQGDEGYNPDIVTLTRDYIIKNNQLITEVNIPSSIKVIEEDIFKDTFIKRVNYHSSIENYLNVKLANLYSNPLINNGDFYYKENELILLKELNVSGNIEEVNDYSFAFINSLQKVIISEGVKRIGIKAFMDCYNLSEIVLPNSIVSIQSAAFSGTKIKNIDIPEKVLDIKANLFMNCRELECINLHTKIHTIDNYAFYNCINLKGINLPEGLEMIGESGFANCRSVEKVKIPDSVKVIGGSCFLACVSLKEIILSHNLRAVMAFTFRMCSSLERIVIPNSVKKVGSFAFDKCVNLKEIKLANSIKTIGLRAFKDCTSLEKFLIPLGMESIGLCAFENCFSLHLVYLPKSLKSLENNAFLGCKNLIICIEISEQEYKNGEYSYYGLDNLLSSCYIKWNYKINRK